MAKRKRKNAAAVELGRRGGKRTAKRLTPIQRSEAARHAVNERWRRYREAKGAA